MCNVRHLEPKACRQHGRKFSLDFLSLVLIFSVTVLAVSCSTTSSNNVAAPSSSSASLSLTPDNATVASLAQLQFTARVSGTASTAVNWSASAGTISSSGLFTAPQVTTNTPVVIKATSGGQSTPISGTALDSANASAAVTVTPVASLAITTAALPVADASVPYSASLIATGGVAPYAWSLTSGSLPAGILLQNSGGVISGTTALAGSYPLTAKVTDAAGHSATSALSLTVTASSPSGSFDGPAELPRIYIQTAMADTPAPGSTTTVNSGGDLQSALNNASCGDTIQLQAGATFSGA
ncbi:MAG: Ig domain-containing protein [Candidatus Sulfotelmatobacter sp.]